MARRSAAPPSPATAPHLRLSGEQLQPRSRDTHSPGVGTQGQRCSPGPRRSPAPGPGGGGGARATPNPHPGAEQRPARAPAYCTGHCRTGPDPRAGHLTVGCPRSDGERKSRAAGYRESLAWPPDAAPDQTATLRPGARHGGPATPPGARSASLAASVLNAGLLFCFLENVSFAKSNSVKKFVLLKHPPSKHRRADSQGLPQLPWVNGQGPPPPRCGDTALGPGDRPGKRPGLFPRGEFKGMLPKECQGCQRPQVWAQPRQSCQPLGSRWPPLRHPTV